MNTGNDWRATGPRFIAGCALAILLASSTGCLDAATLDPSERPDSLELDDEAVADAATDPNGKPVANATQPATDFSAAGRPIAKPDGESCGVPGKPSAGGEPGKPNSGTEPGKPNAGGEPGKPANGSGVPVARSCIGSLIGDGKSCVSYQDIKLKGSALCDAQGMILTDLKLGEPDCPDGTTQSWVSCCTQEPPTPVATCTGGVLGDGSTCLDQTTIKLKASAACEAQKASLTQLYPSSDPSCAGGAVWAKYECCASVPVASPLPPPPKPGSPDTGVWLK